jgi:hypothetical protein
MSSASPRVSFQIGVATQITITEPITKRSTKTRSAAGPRLMPRRVSRLTSGSSPKANTKASPIVRITSLATMTM